jgi:hypothetical protein
MDSVAGIASVWFMPSFRRSVLYDSPTDPATFIPPSSTNGEISRKRCGYPYMKKLAKQILPSFVQSRLRRVKNAVASPAKIQTYLNRAGYNVALRGDYYSPLTSVSDLKSTFERWHRPSALKGIEYDIDHMKNAIWISCAATWMSFPSFRPTKSCNEWGSVRVYRRGRADAVHDGPSYQPKRYIEVGSGLSTYYCALAATRNASEGHPLAITCIEPYPFEDAQFPV